MLDIVFIILSIIVLAVFFLYIVCKRPEVIYNRTNHIIIAIFLLAWTVCLGVCGSFLAFVFAIIASVLGLVCLKLRLKLS